tara:strand:- start:43 stop:249 length:207 start_codon:yes stop_codon:yes gene_type:complete
LNESQCHRHGGDKKVFEELKHYARVDNGAKTREMDGQTENKSGKWQKLYSNAGKEIAPFVEALAGSCA